MGEQVSLLSIEQRVARGGHFSHLRTHVVVGVHQSVIRRVIRARGELLRRREQCLLRLLALLDLIAQPQHERCELRHRGPESTTLDL